MSEKVYDNEKLEKMLNRYIKEEKYGGFKPLLNEIFQRRAYEFQFDEKQMKKQIKNFVKRTKKIVFCKNHPRLSHNNWMCYDTDMKSEKGIIYLNCDSDMLKQLPNLDWQMIYSLLTHEVYHAIAYDGKMGGLYDIINAVGMSKNEIINETAATRTSYTRTPKDDENYRQETNGYCAITFVANLLAASLGIEERELLKGGIQNRKELEKACQKYISKKDYKNDFLFNFDILESNLDFLYNALYEEEENELDSQVIGASLEEIYSQIYSIASVNVSKSTREITPEYAEELAYNFQKIRTIMTKSLEKFTRYGYITKSDANEILDEVLESSLGYFYKVSDMIALTNRKSEIKDPAVWEEMVEFAKRGELIQNAEKFGMQVGKNPGSRHKLIQYHKKTNHEFENLTQWDNTEVVKIMEQLWNQREVIDVGKFEEEIESKTISHKLLNLITRIQNRKLKKNFKKKKKI